MSELIQKEVIKKEIKFEKGMKVRRLVAKCGEFVADRANEYTIASIDDDVIKLEYQKEFEEIIEGVDGAADTVKKLVRSEISPYTYGLHGKVIGAFGHGQNSKIVASGTMTEMQKLIG